MSEPRPAAASASTKKTTISEVLPKSGLVYSEKGGLAEVLCKPKILPLKSAVLEQLQKIDNPDEPLADFEDEGDFNRHK